jgi:threonine aldolase
MRAAAVDLRSDTVTQPDAAMRRAMAGAEVGDDVYGEDPTMHRLEEEGAAALGHEAALFVPSGTMGNQIALHLHTSPGCEVICDARSHVVHYELGAMAVLSGLLPRVLPSDDGLPAPAAIEARIAPEVSYRARTGLIVVENSHNMAGGRVFGRDRLDPILAVARRHGLPVHLDGARIFNAAVALGTTAAELASGFDSVMFCLSKGLGAPVGSLLCGDAAVIREARRVRKMFGGGMRQAGILAAAGLLALQEGPGRLIDDHERARVLADTLAELPGFELDPATVESNIVICGVGEHPAAHALRDPEAADPAATFLAALSEAGVLASHVGPEHIRFVTHRDVDDVALDAVLEVVERL